MSTVHIKRVVPAGLVDILDLFTFVAAEGLSTGQYQYVYTVAGKACRHTVDQESALPKVGTDIEIHYNPDSICDSATYDSGPVGWVMALAWMLTVIALIRWLRPRTGSE